ALEQPWKMLGLDSVSIVRDRDPKAAILLGRGDRHANEACLPPVVDCIVDEIEQSSLQPLCVRQHRCARWNVELDLHVALLRTTTNGFGDVRGNRKDTHRLARQLFSSSRFELR